MEKEGGVFREEEIIFLNHLIKSLEEALSRLETANQKEDHEYLNKLKKFILEVQEKISEVTA